MTNDSTSTPQGHESSDETQHLAADSTEQLPTVDPTTQLPSTDEAQPVHTDGADWTHAERTEAELRADAEEAGHNDPTEGFGVPAAATTAAAAAASGGGGLPPRPGFWQRIGDAWRRVWARTWGKVAVIAIAGLAVLALVSAIALAAWFGGHEREGRMAGRKGAAVCAQGKQGQGNTGQRGKEQGRSRDCDESGQPSQGGKRQNRGGQGQDGQKGQGGQRGNAMPMNPNGNGMPMNPNGNGGGMGRGGLGNGQGAGNLGGAALQNALHGELTLGGVSPRTVLFQLGDVTEFTAGQSLAVKSSDGFTATYTLTTDTAGPATGVAVGATVRVVADKDGAKATRVQIISAAAGPTN